MQHRPSHSEKGAGDGYFGTIRRIVDADRTGESDAQLGMVLTFIAGAINAGALGFSHLGFLFALPLAALLFGIAVPTLANSPEAREPQ